jgi:hypothetical protein
MADDSIVFQDRVTGILMPILPASRTGLRCLKVLAVIATLFGPMTVITALRVERSVAGRSWIPSISSGDHQ